MVVFHVFQLFKWEQIVQSISVVCDYKLWCYGNNTDFVTKLYNYLDRIAENLTLRVWSHSDELRGFLIAYKLELKMTLMSFSISI